MRRRSLALAAFLILGCVDPQGHPDGGHPPDPHDLVLPEEDDLGRFTPTISGPELLSQTGLYADIKSRTLAPSVVRFSPSYPLWSDDTYKERFLYIPPGQKIQNQNQDLWTFPVGTKAWKHFSTSRGGRLLETRLLWKAVEGEGRAWFYVSYIWDEAQTDAHKAVNGKSAVFGTNHDVPSQKDCAQCHRGAKDQLLGVAAIQLSSPDGLMGESPLQMLSRLSLLAVPFEKNYPPPGEPTVRDALGYLHGNCGSSCHNTLHPLAEARALRMALGTNDRTPEDSDVYRTTFGTLLKHQLPDGLTQVVVKGNPEQSGLLSRMGRRDGFYQMPPLGTKVKDEEGMKGIRAWIAGLK